MSNSRRNMKVTHTNFQKVQFILKKGYRVLCHCSIWLYVFSGVIPLFFSLRDSIPSRNFRWVHRSSRATILASSHLIPALQVVECFARPPSFVFILVVAESMFPASISCFVSRTLFWHVLVFSSPTSCSFRRCTNISCIRTECCIWRSSFCLPKEFLLLLWGLSLVYRFCSQLEIDAL